MCNKQHFTKTNYNFYLSSLVIALKKFDLNPAFDDIFKNAMIKTLIGKDNSSSRFLISNILVKFKQKNQGGKYYQNQYDDMGTSWMCGELQVTTHKKKEFIWNGAIVSILDGKVIDMS